MYTAQNSGQLEFFDNFFMPVPIKKEHPIIKMADSIDWDSLCDNLSKFYCNDNGRPTKSTRAKIGLLLLRHYEKISDEQVVDRLERDIYYQYLCGLNMQEAQNFIEPSSLTHFRNKIGMEGVKMIEEAVRAVIKKSIAKKGGPKNREITVDTTVTASPICYPTDVNLLNTCREKSVEAIKKAEKTGKIKKKARTHKRKGRKTFIEFHKFGRKSKQARKKTQKKLLGFAKRNLRQLQDHIEEMKSSPEPLTAEEMKILKKLEETAERSAPILEQQAKLLQGKKVKDRIVSFHNQDVRPMVRGKYPQTTEFGEKLLLVEYEGFLELADSSSDNVSDSKWLEPALDFVEEHYGFQVEGVGADRGFHGKVSKECCERHNVRRYGVQRKGRPPKNKPEPKPWEERLRRRRCGIEARISLAKRKYGLDRSGYRIEGGGELWVRLGLCAMNLKRALRAS